ncbi:MAG: hypothetical protein ABR517_04860 [Thermoanaerobaculia bacterium]
MSSADRLESSGPERITRETAVRRLRDVLVLLTDDDHSICRVAAEKKIFCGGFSRDSDEELRRRYPWLVARNPSSTRAQIEEAANRWQISRQVFDGLPLACDVQNLEHDTCDGWDEFTNADLARFCRELLHEDVIVESTSELSGGTS